MFEHPHEPLLPRKRFLLRMVRVLLAIGGLIACSLAIGVAGYHFTENLPIIDSVLNASMILTGMGPVAELHSNAGKLFASAYALFSGVVFLSLVAIVVAPVAHRLVHKFHLAGTYAKSPKPHATDRLPSKETP